MFKHSIVNVFILVCCILNAVTGSEEVSLRGTQNQRELAEFCSGRWANGFPTGACPTQHRDGTPVGRIECDLNFILQPVVRNKKNKNGKCNRKLEMQCIPLMKCICDTRTDEEWDCRESAAVEYCDKPPAGAWEPCVL